jgi:hypothetical protein
MADPEYWIAEKVANHLRVTGTTVRAYVASNLSRPPINRAA